MHTTERVRFHFIRVKHLGHAIQANQTLFRRIHALLLREVPKIRACVFLPAGWYVAKGSKCSAVISIAPGRNCPRPTCRTGSLYRLLPNLLRFRLCLRTNGPVVPERGW